jgi:hypothetical protein
MLSAFLIVESLWAMIMVVLPLAAASRAIWTAFSDAEYQKLAFSFLLRKILGILCLLE